MTKYKSNCFVFNPDADPDEEHEYANKFKDKNFSLDDQLELIEDENEGVFSSDEDMFIFSELNDNFNPINIARETTENTDTASGPEDSDEENAKDSDEGGTKDNSGELAEDSDDFIDRIYLALA